MTERIVRAFSGFNTDRVEGRNDEYNKNWIQDLISFVTVL